MSDSESDRELQEEEGDYVDYDSETDRVGHSEEPAREYVVPSAAFPSTSANLSLLDVAGAPLLHPDGLHYSRSSEWFPSDTAAPYLRLRALQCP